MALVLVATAGAANANSYETVLEADAYFEARLPLATPWEDAESKEILLVMGTRVLDTLFRGSKVLMPAVGGQPAFYRVTRAWTGAPATTTQRLAWPRTGMYDQNGNALSSSTIPQDLKDALSELAGQLGLGDRTLDSDVVVQGISSVSAGSVSVSFRDGVLPQVLPDAVMALIPPSWYTEEIIESVMSFEFDVI